MGWGGWPWWQRAVFPCCSHSFIHSSHSLEKGAGRMLQTEQGQRSHPAYHGSLCGKGWSRFPNALQKAGIYSTRAPRLWDLLNTQQTLPNNPSSNSSRGTADALRPLPGPDPPLRDSCAPNSQRNSQAGLSPTLCSFQHKNCTNIP